jgi:cardiolipin synthase
MYRRAIPNWLTYSRILAVPLVVAAFFLPSPWCAWTTTGLFFYASLTDLLDGYLARAWNAQSLLGKALDPIADKLLVVAALVMLVSQDRVHLIPTLVILLREVLVSGLREVMMESRIPMPVSSLAKYKTAVQMTAICLLLLAPAAGEGMQDAGQGCLWIAAVLTAITGLQYVRVALRAL